MPIFDLSKSYKRQSFNEWVEKLIEKGKTVRLETVTTKRTLDQNSLHWLWMTVLEKETGNQKQELHLLYRANFLAKSDEYITSIIIPKLWEKVKVKIQFFQYFKGLEDIIDVISFSTTGLDKKEMSLFMDKIKHHALNSMGVTLLTQDEENYIDFLNEYRH